MPDVPDAAGNQIVFTTTVTSDKFIQEIAIKTSIFPGRDLSLNNTGSATFSIANAVVNNVNFVGMVEGASYEFDNGGSKSILRVDKLSWVVHASDGNAKIADSSATSTYLYCKSPGLTELVVDVRLSWHQAGESYTSNFKPETSGLFAYYSANGRATFDKYPENLVYLTSRMIAMKEFEFTVNQQKRVVTAGNTELPEPVLLGRSSLWPASAPIMITAALPCMVHGRTGKWLSQDGDFRFITPVELDENIDLIPLKLGGRFSTTIYDRDTLFSTQLAPIAIVKPDDGLLELRINPSGPVITYEGATATFTAEVRPTVDFGSGSLSDATDDLDLFNGYRLSKVEHIQWFEVPLDASGDWKNKAPAGKGFTHFFTADSGPGSYTMNCAVSLEMKESDTGDTFIVGADNSVPVDVLPGLTIFSPIDELAYPLNATIKVKTSFDADEANWKNIVWRLNGKLFKPDTAGAPFFITANRFGKWSLEAVLTIKDPVTGTSTEMRDRITFAVKPCEISLSPGRKVFDMAVQNTQGLDLAVSLDGKTVERPGKAVPWQGNDIIAVVEPVAWSMVATPTACATIDTDEESFSAGLQFLSHGAATVLATVTVRIAGADDYFRRHAKDFEDEFEEPVFTFPAVRADLWALSAPRWKNTVSEMPTRAIQNTSRLFLMNAGIIKFADQEYDWSSHTDFNGKIKLPAAMPNVYPLTSAEVKISWIGPGGQTSQQPDFKPLFAEPGKQEVVMYSVMEFDTGNRLEFDKIETEVGIEPLTKVIYGKITANPSTINVNQPSQVSFRFGEIAGGAESQTQLDLWGGGYNIWLDDVKWSSSADTILPNEPNVQFANGIPGQYVISGEPHFSVKPKNCEPAKMSLDTNKVTVTVLGSLVSLRVDKSIPDHLENIRDALEHKKDIYEKTAHRVWSKQETAPLVVGCSSTITMLPKFAGQKTYKIRNGVSFQWFDSEGALSLSGITDLNDTICLPTPAGIDRYILNLNFAVVGETVEMTKVYTVKKITRSVGNVVGTANKVFFTRCIEDSVKALKRHNSATPDARMVNDFYAWWWKLYPSDNDLKYGIPKSFNTYEVINKNGGMCQGFGNYFFKCLECYGIAGLYRVSLHLHNIKMHLANKLKEEIPGTDIDHFPYFHEHWGAIFMKNLGLNNEKPLFWIPNNESTSYTPYLREQLKVYQGNKKVPSSNLKDVLVDLDSNVEIHEQSEGFCFRAPDGHAFVLFKDMDSGKINLMDPSFYYNRTMVELPRIPPETAVLIKDIDKDPDPEYKSLLEYLNYFSYFRGNTAFKTTHIAVGMAIFDFCPEQMNYLKVSFKYYISEEEIMR